MVLTARKGGGGRFIILLGLCLGLASTECAGPEHFNSRPDAGGLGTPGVAGAGVAGTGAAGDTSLAGSGGSPALSGAAGDTSAAGAGPDATGVAGANGPAGMNGAAGTGATAGTSGAAGAGAAGKGAAGTGAGAAGTGAAGNGAAGTGAAGTGAAGTGAAGLGAAAVNGCQNANWTFTPEYTCDPTTNTNCGFCTQYPTQCAPQDAIDGDPTTRYTDGKSQSGGEFVTVTFARAVKVSGMNVVTTSAGDGAKGYQLQYSTDGATFMAFAPAIAGTGADNLTIPFPATVMRAIRMIQTGVATTPAADPAWWSINEITFTGCVAQ
jgi:F5/8 type C domain